MRQVGWFILLLFPLLCNAQTNTVACSRDYEFKEGIFLTLQHFKNNTPILKSAIVSVLPKDQLDFFTQVLEQNVVVYKDSAGVEQKLQRSAVWGYSQNRAIYVNFNNEFNRLNVIGTLSLFSAMIVSSPMRSDPINDMYAIQPTFQELRQFIFDSQTNKIVDFNVKNMELLLKNDAELYAEFIKLKKRKKADSIFIYLRKYNEKYPLYLAAK
ncbi:MAG: hypothetical protein IPP64_04950 [Bacteroidetes bacterium]|nr:hypothetical protein [Bacteroidota bacterium]